MLSLGHALVSTFRPSSGLGLVSVLSHPDRHESFGTIIEIEYHNLQGELLKERLEGFPARIFQHEYDHLDKVLFIDRFYDEEDKESNQRKLDKLIKKYGAGGAP